MIKRILTSKKGSSSVFVMLLLVVLMVFGLAALSIALSNVRLGAKVADFNAAYYAAEGEAWKRFAEMDKAVWQAYAQTPETAEDAVIRQIETLGFETQVKSDGGTVMISYEAHDAESGIAIEVTLALDTDDERSLRAVEWRQRKS